MSINIEKDILRYGLLAGLLYQLYQSSLSFSPGVPLITLLINLLLTVLTGSLYLLTARDRLVSHCAFFIHLVALGGFTFFWANHGGVAGTVPGFLCVYLPFIVLTSHYAYRNVCLLLLALLLLLYFAFPQWLGMEHYQEPQKIALFQLSLDYVVLAFLIVAFSVFLKNRFLFYRRETGKRYLQLDKVVSRHQRQQLEIVARQEEIMTINDSLESVVRERTAEIEIKNQSLKEYAFINAHLLRSPICRIIGILHLMEMEPERYSLEEISKMQDVAKTIDEEIQKVNYLIGI